jgi:hypothetical protein
VVFTDGSDNASSVQLAKLERDLDPAGSPALYLIAMPSKNPGKNEARERKDSEKNALALARMGGGFTYFPQNQSDADASVDRLVDTLGSRYLLTYTSGNASKDGRVRRIDVELDKVHQRAKAVVRAPEGYYAPSQ